MQARLRFAAAALTAGLGTPSQAATPQTAQGPPGLQPITAPVRHAGTLHVATGTWTRHTSQAALGADVIYSNTASSGYFSSLAGSPPDAAPPTIDEGRIPTLGGSIASADRTVYSIEGLEFGYCATNQGPTVGITFDLWDSYEPCSAAYSAPSSSNHFAGSVTATGLPGGQQGVAGCWTVTLDLSGPGQICMEGDGGPLARGFDGDVTLDSFGLAWIFHKTPGAQSGPILSGDPNWTPVASGALQHGGSGTYYGPSPSCADTGLDTLDFMRLEEPHAFAGCRFFGGYKNMVGCGAAAVVPMASFYSVLFASSSECDTLGERFCSPASTTSSGTPVSLTASAIQAGSGVHLDASGGPPANPGYFLGSLLPVDPGVSLSQGFLCLGGTLLRYAPSAGPDFDSLGFFDAAGDLANASGTSGTGFGFDLPAETPAPASSVLSGDTWNFQLWFRDVNPSAGSNFSDAIRIAF